MYLAADKYLTMKKSQPTVEEPVDLGELDMEQQVEVVSLALEHFCEELEARGLEPAMIDALLLAVFSQRMADLGDRATYEEMLNNALDDPWDEHSIH